ncbi:unnamed protein product [Mesocestoides corti]|uniref:Fibronectin type-III domain-containing protein n=1 Tax=Mesocestoides corti TaxID=53468 RepID=A0A3P6GE41_MESCO|nr:unnamed protein product [Mesocestoides corti]
MHVLPSSDLVGLKLFSMSMQTFRAKFDVLSTKIETTQPLPQCAMRSLQPVLQTIGSLPAPRGISLEKQLMHSIIVSWKPPEFQEVTAYHVYADGQFRASVGGHEKRRALVENIDASKQHRISIRTVTSRGQSKDAECTLLVGKGASPAPTRLKASHITTNSCKLSWLPGSSNFYHAIFLNNHELRVCPPGVYKLFLTGLHPNTLHCVRVESKCSSGSNEPPPACNLSQSSQITGLPSPPRNVQVEAGPQDGVLLISWRPVPQATHVFPKCENEQLVQGYTVCINDHPLMDVPGAERELKSGISILHHLILLTFVLIIPLNQVGIQFRPTLADAIPTALNYAGIDVKLFGSFGANLQSSDTFKASQHGIHSLRC